MQEPKDSLNIEIFGFKASAVGRFAVVSLLIFFLGLVAFGWAFGLGQIAQYLPHQQIETTAK